MKVVPQYCAAFAVAAKGELLSVQGESDFLGRERDCFRCGEG